MNIFLALISCGCLFALGYCVRINVELKHKGMVYFGIIIALILSLNFAWIASQ